MARPEKQGITYFSFDVDFFSDIKVKKIMRACGPKSIPVLINLLCNIYRDKGYYIEWDDEIGFLVSDEVGANESIAEEVVNKCLQVGFFDKDIFEKYKLLTSKGIQERYLKATYQRKNNAINPDLLMIKDEKQGYSHEKHMNNSVNHAESTQSKVKKSKVNKNKKEDVVKDEISLQSLSDFFSSNFHPISQRELEQLREFVDDIGYEMVRLALEIAIDNNARKLSYVRSIITNWKNDNIQTPEEYQAFEAERKRKFASKNQKSFQQQKPVKKPPEWTDEGRLIKAGVDTTGMSQNEMYKLAGEMGLHNE